MSKYWKITNLSILDPMINTLIVKYEKIWNNFKKLSCFYIQKCLDWSFLCSKYQIILKFTLLFSTINYISWDSSNAKKDPNHNCSFVFIILNDYMDNYSDYQVWKVCYPVYYIQQQFSGGFLSWKLI